MKYFFDTEFIECHKRPIPWLPTIGRFNKPYHSIELISIGIVAEDGRQYYAVSKEYNYADANDWVKENVIAKIYTEQIAHFKRQYMGIDTFHKYLPGTVGRTKKQIASDIVNFVNPHLGWPIFSYNNSELGPGGSMHKHFEDHDVVIIDGNYCAQPKFYAYYADYDWVVFCALFGTMMDLPKGFPKYCRDLKQQLDNLTVELHKRGKELPPRAKQENEHNALDDAKWNFNLYKFIEEMRQTIEQ